MLRHPGIPLYLICCTCLILEFTPLDILIQDEIYNFGAHQWAIDRDNLVLEFIFYDLVKVLYGLFIISVASILLFFRNRERVKPYRKSLMIVLLSLLLVPITIGVLKTLTNTPCPKNISHFGGSYPYVTAFQAYPETFIQDRKVACFPAGHASGGFALMSLFFLFKQRQAQGIAIATGATIGWITGIYKMLIGDHFFSHTLISMELTWLIILLIFSLVEFISQHKARKIPVTL